MREYLGCWEGGWGGRGWGGGGERQSSHDVETTVLREREEACGPHAWSFCFQSLSTLNKFKIDDPESMCVCVCLSVRVPVPRK